MPSFRSLRSAAAALALAAGGLAVGISVTSHADGDPATDGVPRVIPYQGVLELDGAPYNGDVEIIFTLHPASSGAATLWTETQSVSVYNGTFSVSLGTVAPIAATLLAADSLWIGLNVDGVAMANRQRITPVPYALWSAQSSDFTVARDARVERNLSVIGTSTVTGLTTANGGLTVAGSLTLPTGSLTSAMLADGTVANADLANNAVNSAKIADGAIATADLADGAVNSAKIADGAVNSADIADNSITRTDLLGTETAVYEITNAYCSSRGVLTLNTQCLRNPEVCTSGGFPSGYRDCNNVCQPLGSGSAYNCDNTLRGYLFAP